jgi:hypothetical protein
MIIFSNSFSSPFILNYVFFLVAQNGIREIMSRIGTNTCSLSTTGISSYFSSVRENHSLSFSTFVCVCFSSL